jgi:hypothetical protein
MEECMKHVFSLALLITGAVLCLAPAAANDLLYRVTNAYNQETVGHVRRASTADTQLVNVSVDSPALGLSRTEVHAGDGLWLRYTIDSHGVPTEYEFSPALPARPALLNVGASWSTRVNAMVTLGGERVRRSVRVDGTVLGAERVRVPAGEFDTVKIRRIIYSGDQQTSRAETRILEFEWYAPALGRGVRTETRSSWMESCGRRTCEYRGDWFIHELAQAGAAAK